jgi:hypothetical protein
VRCGETKGGCIGMCVLGGVAMMRCWLGLAVLFCLFALMGFYILAIQLKHHCSTITHTITHTNTHTTTITPQILDRRSPKPTQPTKHTPQHTTLPRLLGPLDPHKLRGCVVQSGSQSPALLNAPSPSGISELDSEPSHCHILQLLNHDDRLLLPEDARGDPIPL